MSVSGSVANSILRTPDEGDITNHKFSAHSWSATFEFKGVPGVVRRAYASASKTGRPARKLRKGAREAWATFQLASQPTAAPITVSWYQGRRLLGSREKSNRPVIQTGIGASAGLPSAAYRVDLVAGGRVVRRLNVQVAK